MPDVTPPLPNIDGFKLVSIPTYAKIKGVSRQAVYERIDRGTLPVYLRKKAVKMVIIDEDEIPEDLQGKALDLSKGRL